MQVICIKIHAILRKRLIVVPNMRSFPSRSVGRPSSRFGRDFERFPSIVPGGIVQPGRKNREEHNAKGQGEKQDKPSAGVHDQGGHDTDGQGDVGGPGERQNEGRQHEKHIQGHENGKLLGGVL